MFGFDRSFRTRPKHWQVVMDFFEEYPILLNGSLSEKNSEKCKWLWKKLAEQLNSLGDGVKTPEKWQLAISRWKSKVKTKALQLQKQLNKPGASQSETAQLNSTEGRLMAAMGWKIVVVDDNFEFECATNDPGKDTIVSDSNDHSYVDIPSTSAMNPPSPTPITYSSSSPPPLHFKEEPVPTLTAGTKKRKRIPFVQRRTKTNMTSQMHKEKLYMFTNLNENMAEISKSLKGINQNLNILVNVLVKKFG